MCAGHVKPCMHVIGEQRPFVWQANPAPHDVPPSGALAQRGVQRVLVGSPLGLQNPLAGVHGFTYDSQ